MNTETFQLNFQSVAVIAIVLSVISLIFVGVALIGPFEGQSEKLKQKRLDTKRAFIIALLVLVIAVAFCVGAVITSKQKDIIWNVIDSIVSVISAVGTVGAIIAAIWVADRQNKITLFEKRYECFQFYEECIVLYKQLLSKPLGVVIEVQCCHMLGVDKLNDLSKHDFQNKVKQFEYLLHQMAFLFPGIKEDDTSELYYSLAKFFAAILDKQGVEESKLKYIQEIKKFNKYSHTIWDCMMLSNIK